MPLQNKFPVAALCCAAALIAAGSLAARAADFTYNEKTNADLAKKLKIPVYFAVPASARTSARDATASRSFCSSAIFRSSRRSSSSENCCIRLTL